jgi:MSHA biogenesis protein MshL
MVLRHHEAGEVQGYVLDRVGRRLRIGAALVLVFLLAGCQGIAPEPRPISSGHLSDKAPATPAVSNIPAPVRRTPFVPKPVAEAPTETYTVVVNDVPVKELLFALARDASINVDIHPDVSGQATINAVDQSLTQILDRVARQLNLRYEISGGNVSIQPDTPFVRNYRVDYVDLSRQSTTSSSVSTQIASTSTSAVDSGGGGGGGGGNNSTTTVTSESSYPFWEMLVANIRNLVSGSGTFEGLDAEETVIANTSSGVLMVRATGAQHEEVQRYLDEVKAASRRQVLIEATIVEVELNDSYRAGIDWQKLAQGAGWSVAQTLTAGVAASVTNPPNFQLSYTNATGDISGSVSLLQTFGDTRVLSSPKIMALNNQTALLKVVENTVYFEVKSQSTQGAVGGTVLSSAETTAKSVSVGVVMSVTPQINGTDEVTLLVRPTISRINGEKQDPNPSLINPVTGVITPNLVPEIAVREMESVLRIGSGQLAVLGGLMTDDLKKDSDAVPWVSESETFGDLFTSRANVYSKTELVIFLRPWVIQTPDVQADLKSFEPFLPQNLEQGEPVTSRFSKDLP